MILITGGTGYLAGIIANYFVDRGFPVKVGTRNKDLISKKILNKADVINLDLLSIESLNNALKDISSVFHLSSMNYEDCKSDPNEAKKINEDCTKNILRVSTERNVKKFVYFSTIHVYGDNLKGNVTEQTLPLPQSVYAKTHLNAEEIVKNLSEERNIEYLILRLTNVSSPPITAEVNCWHLVIHDLCKQAIINKKIKLKSNGDQFRDFVHVNVLNNILEFFINNTGLSGIYNFGSGELTKIKDIAEIIQSEFKKMYSINPEIILGEKKVNEDLFSYNIEKLKRFFPNLKSFSNEYIIKELLLFCNKNFY